MEKLAGVFPVLLKTTETIIQILPCHMCTNLVSTSMQLVQLSSFVRTPVTLTRAMIYILMEIYNDMFSHLLEHSVQDKFPCFSILVVTLY